MQRGGGHNWGQSNEQRLDPQGSRTTILCWLHIFTQIKSYRIPHARYCIVKLKYSILEVVRLPSKVVVEQNVGSDSRGKGVMEYDVARALDDAFATWFVV